MPPGLVDSSGNLHCPTLRGNQDIRIEILGVLSGTIGRADPQPFGISTLPMKYYARESVMQKNTQQSNISYPATSSDRCPLKRSAQKPREMGTSMVESLIAIAIISLVLPSCLAFFFSFQRHILENAAALDAESSAQAIFSRISLLLQQAGNNPWGISLIPIHLLPAGGFYVESDSNGGAGNLPDGSLDGTYERVSIEWDEAGRQVYQRSGNGSRQPLASGVRLLAMQGIDRNGQPTNSDPEIVWVELHIITESPLRGPKDKEMQIADWTLRLPLFSRLEGR
jgi:hypothetical protein